MPDVQETPQPATEETSAAPAEARLRVRRKEPCPCGSGKKFKNGCIGKPEYEVIEDAPPPATHTPSEAELAKRSKSGIPGRQAPPRAVSSSRPANAIFRRKV